MTLSSEQSIAGSMQRRRRSSSAASSSSSSSVSPSNFTHKRPRRAVESESVDSLHPHASTSSAASPKGKQRTADESDAGSHELARQSLQIEENSAESQHLRSSDRNEARSQAASKDAGPARRTSTAGQGSSSSPPRARQPPLSQSAWSSLRDQAPVTTPLSARRASLPERQSTVSDSIAPHRTIIPLPRRSLGISPSVPHPEGTPASGSSADIFSRSIPEARHAPPRATFGGPHRSFLASLPQTAASMATSPMATSPPIPTSGDTADPSLLRLPTNLVCLMSDVLGAAFNRIVGEQFEIAPTPQASQAGAVPPAEQSNASGANSAPQSSLARALPSPSRGQPWSFRPLSTTDRQRHRQTLASLGQANIIVQGAMTNRMDARGSQGLAVPTSSSTPASEGHSTGLPHGLNPLRPQGATSRGNASDANDSASGFLNGDAPNSAPSAAAPTRESMIDEQADMLARLLSLTAAGTAASLMHSRALNNSQETRPADGSSLAQSHSVPGPAVSIPPQQPSRPLSLSFVSDLIRRRVSSFSQPIAHWASRFLSGSSSRPVTSSRVAMDGDEAEIDSRLGPGSRAAHRPSTTGPFGEMTLSEMLREAINSRDSGHTPVQDDAATDGEQDEDEGMEEDHEEEDVTEEPASDESPYDHLRRILANLRDNRLQDGPEGSFEHWLLELRGEIRSAMRRASGEEAVATDSTDVQQGSLRFFRMFRLDEWMRQRQGASTAEPPISAPGRLDIPCIMVALRTAPLTPPLQAAVGRPRSLGEMLRNANRWPSTTAAPPAAAPPSEATPSNDGQVPATAPEADTQGTANSATTSVSNVPSAAATVDDPSRFLLYVSGGHYNSSHPIFSTPTHLAARDLSVIMDILASWSTLGGTGAGAGGFGGAFGVPVGIPRQDQTVSQELIDRSGLQVKTWEEIQKRCVEVEPDEVGSKKEEAIKAATATVEPTDSASTSTSPSGPSSTSSKSDPLPLPTPHHCSICLEEWSATSLCRIMSCRHVFHVACVDEWLKTSSNTCPLCRVVAVDKGAATANVV